MSSSRIKRKAQMNKIESGMEQRFKDSTEDSPKIKVWKLKLEEFKTYKNDYFKLIDQRDSAEQTRREATENATDSKAELIKTLKQTNNSVLSVISEDDVKYKEFVKTKTIAQITSLPAGELVESAKHYSAVAKKNIGSGINQEIVTKLENSIDKYNKSLSASQAANINEDKLIKLLQKTDVEADKVIKKILLYIESEVTAEEFNNYFD